MTPVYSADFWHEAGICRATRGTAYWDYALRRSPTGISRPAFPPMSGAVEGFRVCRRSQ